MDASHPERAARATNRHPCAWTRARPRRHLLVAAAYAALIAVGSPASASTIAIEPGIYTLLNHRDGTEAPPLYGLRLDGLERYGGHGGYGGYEDRPAYDDHRGRGRGRGRGWDRDDDHRGRGRNDDWDDDDWDDDDHRGRGRGRGGWGHDRDDDDRDDDWDDRDDDRGHHGGYGKSDVYTFDFESNGANVIMAFENDGNRATIDIMGTVFGGLNEGDGYRDPRLWTLEMHYEMHPEPDEDGRWISLVDPERNRGFISDGEDRYELAAYGGPPSFLIGRGHRTPKDTVSGWGWVNHAPEGRDPLDDEHVYSSDFLFEVGRPVPEPGAGLLLAAGIGSLARSRRRR